MAPFDLDDLLAGVRRALEEPPLAAELAAAAPAAEVPAGTARAARLMAERSRAALFRWVLRLREVEPWASRADLHLAQLLDSAPVIVEAVVATVRTGDAERVLRAHPAVLAGARTHAQTRQQQGIDLAAVLRELAMLRTDLGAIVSPGLPQGLTAADGRRVQDALERVSSATTDAYTAPTADRVERTADASSA